MFRNLLEKSVIFSKVYEENPDLSLLVNCESVPQYKDILRALNKITLKDLYLDESTIQQSFVRGFISAATVVETTSISIGYFFLPAGMSLPLHDHPGMLVTSKVLMGEVNRRALDLVDRENQFDLPLNPMFEIEDQPKTGPRLDAVVESDETFHEGEMLNLTPVKGNVHSFAAVKDTIILDILTPYYDQQTRFCNFYAEVDNFKPGLKSKLAKKPVSEENKKTSGYKTTLVYLYEPASPINFKILPCSEGILKEVS